MKKAKKSREWPVFHPALGDFLKRLREARHWSLRTALKTAGSDLSYAVLYRMENGQIANPDPNALRAITSIYGVPYEDLVVLITQERYNVTLVRPNDTANASTTRLETHVGEAAQARRQMELSEAMTSFQLKIDALQQDLQRLATQQQQLHPGIA